eukprot:GEZU01008130.1.p1 GENE.GEZU01008130.1~~GEZU01008130.1.p1  ORF type:complete len:149 (+),score=19.29 GEZU01008130.1:75-521(+)
MSNRGSVGAASNNTSYAPARKAWLDALKRHSQTKLATPRNIDNSDLILYSCDGSAHHVHRHVLSVYSEYFADLFEDAEEGASFEYNAEFSNDVMKEILQWTYTGELALPLSLPRNSTKCATTEFGASSPILAPSCSFFFVFVIVIIII